MTTKKATAKALTQRARRKNAKGRDGSRSEAYAAAPEEMPHQKKYRGPSASPQDDGKRDLEGVW
jgi:hypothetical protein